MDVAMRQGMIFQEVFEGMLGVLNGILHQQLCQSGQ